MVLFLLLDTHSTLLRLIFLRVFVCLSVFCISFHLIIPGIVSSSEVVVGAGKKEPAPIEASGTLRPLPLRRPVEFS